MPTKEELLAKAEVPAARAMAWHPFYKGKVGTGLKCPVRSLSDLAVWYTPGVAAPCKAIHEDPAAVWEHTNRGNSIAVVSDGTRVLGLGDIGPGAGLPVMEGKALLFKYLGGVDAVPICLGTKDADEIVRTVELLEPSFGGINLEDISQPKCFDVLDRCRERLSIPVWHDDQQGTATVTLAGLQNALEVVGKELHAVRIALVGCGAANVAVYRLLRAAGVAGEQVIACDSKGTLHPGRADIESKHRQFADKWAMCRETNPERIGGGVTNATRGADVMIAFARPGPDLVLPSDVAGMRRNAIVFACANPIPEIWPWDAQAAGAAVVATGRGDFNNQVNNSLGFPGIFRGALDVRAQGISNEMALAAARELSSFARARGVTENNIVPRMDEWEVFPRVAATVGQQAVREGLAAVPRHYDELLESATAVITRARESLGTLYEAGLIPSPPPDP
jgi:malate dehydrogenase (oxaloacetate-decarboxylating)